VIATLPLVTLQALAQPLYNRGGTSAAARERNENKCVRVVRWTSIAHQQLGDAVASLLV